MAPNERGLPKGEYDIERSWKKKSRSGQLTLHKKGSVIATKQQEEKTSGIKASGRPAEDETVKKTSGNEASGRPAEDETVKKTSQEELVDNFERHDDVEPRQRDVKR